MTGYDDLPGQTVIFFAGEWQHWDGHHTLRLRITRVLEEQSRYRDGELWVDGEQLDSTGAFVQRLQVPVLESAIPDAIARELAHRDAGALVDHKPKHAG